MSIQQYPSSPSPSVAFPSMERGVASLSLSTPPASSPNGVPRSPDGSPLRVPMPRSGSRAYKSPSTTPSRQGPPSRTMAVLMRSAAKVHRLAIESRIIDAGFDILAERSEHWYTPEDDDFLAEFLARDGASALHKWVPRLTNGSIYVLVLERDDAAKAWLDLLGSEDQGHRDGDDEDEDDDDGGIIANFGADGLPIVRNGLRKTYGADAFYGSANDAAAEAQISICFPELSRHGNGGDDAVEHSDDYMLTGRTGSPTEEMQRARRVLRDSDASLNARTRG
ncbi:uncharacterized protein PFL1_06596 [Pseudozyma flocculosa PF-1]|uniref:Nucleoside diphosphate kinase n=1 Tax=Pseudozyma flocculosa PF-1 TaxID=1277687 RepID=A0A061H0P6_9BASI|nr:uncharacterized protein PFL1_06596 [Pseudozyma flocculosa PF-1]EPQ25922.1 hypothetical protein PFL1_06596 [Pseudozyma flocculosa PF-1]